jgi:FMN-binding domain/4Fe-4S binding domain
MKKRVIRFFKILVFFAILFAFWLGGQKKSADIAPRIERIFKETGSIEEADGIYAAYRSNSDDDKELLGWAATGTASGYGGPLLVVTGIDTSGNFVSAEVVEHRETYVFFKLARPETVFHKLKGKSILDIAERNYTLESISGATRSLEAVTGSINDALGKISAGRFGIDLPDPEYPLEFGLPEITVILLFAVGILAWSKKLKSAKKLRLASQAMGLAVIGFWENSPVTLAKIFSLLSGYFPDLRSELYWYLLLGGFAFSILIVGSNIHCRYVCPFGALQRFIGLIGGAHKKLAARVVSVLIVLRNYTVLVLLFIVLLNRNPGLASYEPFGVAFAFSGTTLLWFLFAVVLVFSLITENPWCHLFCPMQACAVFLKNTRRNVLELKNKLNHST